jgi:hypothetical protein
MMVTKRAGSFHQVPVAKRRGGDVRCERWGIATGMCRSRTSRILYILTPVLSGLLIRNVGENVSM